MMRRKRGGLRLRVRGGSVAERERDRHSHASYLQRALDSALTAGVERVGGVGEPFRHAYRVEIPIALKAARPIVGLNDSASVGQYRVEALLPAAGFLERAHEIFIEILAIGFD